MGTLKHGNGRTCS